MTSVAFDRSKQSQPTRSGRVAFECKPCRDFKTAGKTGRKRFVHRERRLAAPGLMEEKADRPIAQYIVTESNRCALNLFAQAIEPKQFRYG